VTECQLDLLSEEILDKAAECLRVIAHPTRLRIVDILMQGEYAVGEIAEMCETPPSQTSEHLRLLKGQGLLDSERRARSVYYKIADPRLPAMLTCIRRCCGARDI
jgi:DNA-binding transcriptional ArsR family regulator